MLQEKPAQLALTQPQAGCQHVNAMLWTIEGSFRDERKSPGNRIGSAPPRGQVRRYFRAATETWAKAGVLRSRGRSKKLAILKPRCSGWTDRATIDSRRRNADEDEPVETCVPALQGAITYLPNR